MTDNNLDNQNLDNQNQNLDNQNQNLDNQTYTKEELDKLLQAETDRKVSKALETAKTKWEEEFSQKLEIEKSEAEKLAKLTEQERMKLEIDKQKADFEAERKQFMREKLELQTVKELSAIGLPTDFSKWIVAETAEEIKTNIDSFKTHWEQALEKAVNEKLSGTTPKTSTKKDGKVITKEEFKKMNYQDRLQLFNDNKELYEQLKAN